MSARSASVRNGCAAKRVATDPRTVVLVHGAWHGAWCWDALVQRLDALDVPSVAVDNPSVASVPSDLADDAANLTRALDAVDGPVLLVGHSYGGAVITEAGAHPNVEQLVYLTAFPLEPGESVGENGLTGGEEMKLSEALVFDGDVITVEPARIAEFFYNDCSPEVAANAAAQVRPMSMIAMFSTATRAAWRERPATFVLCRKDRVLPVALQQSCANRVDKVFEMPTSHSPMLSCPDELAALLVDLSRG
jgi:pimeloyl-ACP methyl ester carboxylesterase